MPRSITIAIIAVSLVVSAGIAFSAARTEYRSVQNPFQDTAADTAAEDEAPQPSRAELAVNALAAAYPQRVEKAEFRNDDWAVLMDGRWYYYAGGKMLPEELLEQAEGYSGSFGIFNYQGELPPWTEPTPEQAARYREGRGGGNRGGSPGEPRPRRQRSYHFRDALWRAGSREESSRRVETIKFLNFSLTVHSDIVNALSQVEGRITAAGRTDPEVRSWIAGIGEMHGWNWRNVAGSQSRSNHSYGIAVDILPKSLDGRETYWQWAAQRGREWWNIPYEERYHPPAAVVKAFEAYGFMWGGKWPRFDTMHFEYRPEVFVLSGLDLIVVQR